MSEDWPPRFTIDTERVLRLFTGDRFYSSSDAALREAVLNAIDACGRRTADNEDLVPHIEVVFDSDARTLTISDNGDGMNRGDLQNLFTKVGASAAQLADQAKSGQYKAVGEFGIGAVSYFLVSDQYQLHTVKKGADPVGLEFNVAMLNGVTAARDIACERSDVGTTLVMLIKKDEGVFDRLVERFPFWVRDVRGLTAKKQPGDVSLQQGGLSTHIRPVAVETPPWVEKADLGPPSIFDVWNAFDGRAHVDVLYRGVFVTSLSVERLWGIEGSVHVDPKEFKPKLNREGFVGGELSEEVSRFLQSIHPKVLLAAAECLRDILSSENTRDWSVLKWATLWLAVPRSGAYSEAAKAWDEEFRNRKAFRLLAGDNAHRDVSIADLQDLKADKIFVAPNPLVSDIVKQAVRVLCARGTPVVQGVIRDGSYLGYASLSAQSTSDLLIQYFKDVLPDLASVESAAQKLVQEESAVEILDGPPRVLAVRLGPQGAPIVGVSNEVWINIESQGGKDVIRDLCDRNEGFLGLWLAFLRHASGHVGSVAAQLQNAVAAPIRLGPVKRQYLRRLLT